MVSKKLFWCSDIDGVIVDSRELVLESYARVGIQMPPEAWGHPWQTWLPGAVGSYEAAEKLHKEKTEKYIEVLRSGAAIKAALPFSGILRALERDPACEVYYITGAAELTAITILQELGLNFKNLLAASMTTGDRTAELLKVSPYGTYIDDRIEGQAAADKAGWSFIWAKQGIKNWNA
jgi:hypothetical protein